MKSELRTPNWLGMASLALAFALAGCASKTSPEEGTFEPTKALAPALQARLDRLLHEVRYSKGQTLLAQLREISAFGRNAVEPVLSGLLTSKDARLRAGAVFVLGEIDRLEGDERARKAVSEALADPDNAVRLEAARSLLESGDQRGADVLVQALDDSERGIRVRAFLSLTSASGDSFGYNPDAAAELRRAAAERFRAHFRSRATSGAIGSENTASTVLPHAG